MATRQEMANDMRKQFNGRSFLNMTEVGKHTGWGADKVRSFLDGVEYIKDGKEKKFHVLDLAKRFEEHRSIQVYG